MQLEENPADHPHYRQPAPIDWSGELEAVHEDGRVWRVTRVRNWGNDEWPHAGVADGDDIYMRNDGRCSRKEWGDMPGWRIRNTPQPTPQADTKPDLTARMEALVRKMATWTWVAHTDADKDYAEARAIVALLPEPVDPLHVEARMIAQRHGIVEQDERAPVYLAIEEALRGRALALAGEKEA